MVSDDFSPRYVGNTANPLQVTFTDHEGGAYSLAGLTGASFLLELENTANGAEIQGTGTWSILNPATGFAQYAWNAADVTTAGLYLIHITVTFASGPLSFDRKLLEILPA
jgi:hypothetical protein